MQVMLCGCRYDSDVNIADRWNGTPLMAALRHGHLAIAKMLMSCEATLGDNADPALVQVSNNPLAFYFCVGSSIMLNLANVKMLNMLCRCPSKSGNPF